MRKCSGRQQRDILSLSKTQHLCASSRKISSSLVNSKRLSTTILLHRITNTVSCPHRKAYATLASAPRAGAQVTAKVIQDTAPKNLDNYPTITYWHKRVQLDKKNRRLEFTKTKPGSKRKHKSKGKNIAFWHFQYSDGTVLNYDEVKAIRKDSKKI
jgi:hypothetical protein